MSDGLIVEKHSSPANLFLSDGRVIEARLFLADFAQTHGGPQTVRDLIEEPGDALPAVDADGEFVLILKDAVSAASVVPTELDLEGYWHETPSVLRLVGGHRIDGQLLAEDGSGKRLSDVVNHADRWLRLRRPDELIWVRKSSLVTARSPEA